MENGGILESEHEDSWAVFVDKGYQGASEFVSRAVHPTWKPPNRTLTMQQVTENRDMSSDRIIVENYFGLLCNLGGVLSSKYKWKKTSYNLLFKFAVAFTNMPIKWHSLRNDDVQYYQK